MNGSDIGGVLIVVFGMAAIALRWTAAPPFLVLMIAYFQIFPFGLPELGSENPYEVRETHFRVVDVVLVLAVLVYLRAQYRIFGFVHQIMPSESVLRRKGEVPTRRPSRHIRSDEIAWLIGIASLIVLVGQGVWWVANALEFVPLDSDSPLQWADRTSLTSVRRRPPPGEFTLGQNRFFVMTGAVFFGGLLLRLVFSYWRLRMMKSAEGALVLADTSWAESHRERVRVERWRIWGRNRAKEAAENAAREERAQQREQQRAEERKAERTKERKAERKA
jgi:hypothetical protein